MKVKIKTWERMLKEFPNKWIDFSRVTCPESEYGCLFSTEMEKLMPPDRIIDVGIPFVRENYTRYKWVGKGYYIEDTMIEYFIKDDVFAAGGTIFPESGTWYDGSTKHKKSSHIKQRNYKLTI